MFAADDVVYRVGESDPAAMKSMISKYAGLAMLITNFDPSVRVNESRRVPCRVTDVTVSLEFVNATCALLFTRDQVGHFA